MYIIQLERLERMYNFITSDKNFNLLDELLKIDIILSFFIHCYHLSDWLRESGVESKKIRDYVSKTKDLQICQILAYDIKHMDIRERNPDRKKIIDWRAMGLPWPIVRTYDVFRKEEGNLAFLIDGKERDCHDLMQKCMEAWNTFLDHEGLPKSFEDVNRH